MRRAVYVGSIPDRDRLCAFPVFSPVAVGFMLLTVEG